MRYIIKLLSDWHIGSGLSAGAISNAEVLKDKNDLPYIPGKTIKGLLKDALYEMPENQANRKLINELFGYEIEKASTEKHNGILSFSNAQLLKAEQKEISENNLSNVLYRYITQTKINENGVADNNSLRTMEVCMPIELEGEIMCYKEGVERNLNDDEKELIIKALKWTRRLGVNRNRGLGRCQFVEPKKEKR